MNSFIPSIDGLIEVQVKEELELKLQELEIPMANVQAMILNDDVVKKISEAMLFTFCNDLASNADKLKLNKELVEITISAF